MPRDAARPTSTASRYSRSLSRAASQSSCACCKVTLPPVDHRRQRERCRLATPPPCAAQHPIDHGSRTLGRRAGSGTVVPPSAESSAAATALESQPKRASLAASPPAPRIVNTTKSRTHKSSRSAARRRAVAASETAPSASACSHACAADSRASRRRTASASSRVETGSTVSARERAAAMTDGRNEGTATISRPAGGQQSGSEQPGRNHRSPVHREHLYAGHCEFHLETQGVERGATVANVRRPNSSRSPPLALALRRTPRR